MARADLATWNPQGATPGAAIDPRVVIFHVTAGLGNALPHNGLDWHFHVSLSGHVDQLVDTGFRADANYKANPFAISVETEGLEFGWWTDAQLDSLLMLSEWCLAEHALIRRQRCDRWDGSGFGYHTMWGAPGPWTPVAKSCPGPNRIRQFNEVLLPRILNESEEDMTPEQAATLDRIHWMLEQVKPNADRLPAVQASVDSLAWGVLDPGQGLRVMVADLAGRVVDDVDAAEVARLVLAGLGDVVLSAEQVRSIVDAMPQAVKQALREGVG